ncbi:hypothetical protein IJ579_02425 [bacterium]|nr:hypothetical protein [bacterium]
MRKIWIITVALAISISSASVVNSQTTFVANPVPVATNAPIQYTTVNALDVVANPTRYLKQNIRIVGKFDKFSTLGLDYSPAMRSSENYISFLIQRPDVTNHNIPLSELKIFLKKEVAEKNIDLDAGDKVEFTGKVFSNALGDAWMDVDDFKVLTKKNPKKEEQTFD